MIPVKIITKEEAIKIGLAEDEKGYGVAAAGTMVKRKIDKSEPEIILEKTIIRINGTKEITFMHDERKKQLKDQNKLAKYLDQFDFIEGKEKADFLKENNLEILESK